MDKFVPLPVFPMGWWEPGHGHMEVAWTFSKRQELRLVPDIRRRTDSESSETGGAVELWTELQKIREDLMNVA